MSKTLVIILGETRAHKLTFSNFKENVIDRLQADLCLVKEFPYIMYSVRALNGTTRWANGTYSNKLGYYIKYEGEYNKSTTYKAKYNTSGLGIDDFYLQYFKSLDT